MPTNSFISKFPVQLPMRKQYSDNIRTSSGKRTSAQELRRKFRNISLTSTQMNFGKSHGLRHIFLHGA